MWPLVFLAFGLKICCVLTVTTRRRTSFNALFLCNVPACISSQILVTTIDVVDDMKMLVDLDAFPISEKFLKFEVKGCRDAHLVFCPTINKHAPLYHITIGGWSNTQSILARERVTYEYVDQLDAIGLMDCNIFQKYWVSWENGYIRMGRGNDIDVDVILSYTEVCPFAIHNIELSTSEGQTVDWVIYKTDTPPLESVPIMIQKSFEEVGTCPSFKLIRTTEGHSRTVCAYTCLNDMECSAFYFHANAKMCDILSDSADSNVFDSSYYKMQAWYFR